MVIQESLLHLVLRLRGGGPAPSREIGIAAGGLVKQCILPDPYPASDWDVPRSISFNVQVLNSEHFRQVTGFDPPNTPVTAATYASKGLPFFDIYNEKSNIKGDFKAVKSVMAIDKAKAQGAGHDFEEEASVGNPIISLNPDGSHLSFTPFSIMKEQLKGHNHAQFVDNLPIR